MDFIDTHTHLFSSKFEGDNESAVKRAIDSGVNKMFLPNIDVESIVPMLELAAAFPTLAIAKRQSADLHGLRPAHSFFTPASLA